MHNLQESEEDSLLRIKLVIILIITFLSIVLIWLLFANFKKSAFVPNAAKTSDQWILVWSDEFNKNGRPDTTKWQFENGFVRNNELQWYQPDNAWCEHGLLYIEARKDKKDNPNYVAGSTDWRTNRKFINYTASSMHTKSLQSWKYGRFEMRAKIDTGIGLWPAWWTLGVQNVWPSNGEIDIMEYYKGKLMANIATGTARPYEAEWHSASIRIADFHDNEWADKFHVWKMEWSETEISLFMDTFLLNHIELKDLVNKDTKRFNPFTQNHYMLLNLAIGGDNGGDPSNTIFPRRYQIDYVRVYQKEK